MLKKVLLGSLASVMVMGTSAATAQMSADHAMPQGEFQRLEQPLGLKVGVVIGGLALIGLELWWFLGSKPQPKQAETNQGVQAIGITVDGGYEPSHVLVHAGQPVQLNFFRRDPSSCLDTVLLPDFHIAQGLRLNQVTAVEFTPIEPGQYPFTCGMHMFHGVVEVQD
jgi:plastocyanin domain-containing protein